jgi:beta-galactosidase
MIYRKEIRQIIPLKQGWKFARNQAGEARDLAGSPAGALGEVPTLDEARDTAGVPALDGTPSPDGAVWEDVRVPHDWAIQGPFDINNDRQTASVIDDGITHEITHTGRTGGLPITGTGWYRTTLQISDDVRGSRVFIEFDGVMSDSTVFLNGYEIGSWPYGYTSFSFELTEHIRYGQPNLLEVRVSPLSDSSRFYPGAGIYRHVRLVITNPVHVAQWGTYITTPVITDEKASVHITTTIVNQSGQRTAIQLLTLILDPEGMEVARGMIRRELAESGTFIQQFELDRPVLWELAAPRQYKAVSIVISDGEETDRYETPFGIRSIAFDADQGFLLNGKITKLKGVCLHHDLGPLGAAVNRRAMQRQLEMMQEMGCNAIRTSHNPADPEFLELCDEMGLLVIEEAFDEWGIGKVKNGYYRHFAAWAEKDLRAMIRRDRNHPCIIMWSIGNEIREQVDVNGGKVAKWLTDICHDEDLTRPVTAGFNNSEGAIANGLAAAVDIPGWNYKPHFYGKYRKEHPEWITYGSETSSCVSSTGVYEFPAEEEIPARRRPSLQQSSYDLAAPGWGYAPDKEFLALEENPQMLGEFVWTGFDYLGEPTPYREEWPSRSSYFGIVDLCGIPKDRYYLYRSQWSDQPTLHLAPHWNWEGYEGEPIPVQCYTSFAQAELFLNGKSLGTRKKSNETLYERYRLMWHDVPYEPGTLRIVAYHSDGSPAMAKEVTTAGAPSCIVLRPDRREIRADGDDLCFITVGIVDDEGRLCPRASNAVAFTVQGPAEITAVGNGDATSTESFAANPYHVFNGQCMLIIRSSDGMGDITIGAASEGLAKVVTIIQAK